MKASDMYREGTEGMTEGPWSHESGVGPFHILYEVREDVTLGLVGAVEHSNGDTIPPGEQYNNVAAVCFQRNTRDAVIALLEAVEQNTIHNYYDDETNELVVCCCPICAALTNLKAVMEKVE